VKSLPYKNKLLIDLTASPLWRPIAEMWKCPNPNHCEVMKAEHNRMIPRKFAANLKFLFFATFVYFKKQYVFQ